jgi:AraC-like DNA-binding protein
LEIAKEKLRNTAESNVDIALSCGFNSETYFIRAFKKLYGITPFVYRKQQKSP